MGDVSGMRCLVLQYKFLVGDQLLQGFKVWLPGRCHRHR